MSASTAVKLSHLWAREQGQPSLQHAAVAGGGVELEGQSASIKSMSDSIQSADPDPKRVDQP